MYPVLEHCYMWHTLFYIKLQYAHQYSKEYIPAIARLNLQNMNVTKWKQCDYTNKLKLQTKPSVNLKVIQIYIKLNT